MILTNALHFIISFFIVFNIIPVLILFANEKSVYTSIDHRTCHDHPVPNLGGIALFVGITTSLLLLTKNVHFHKLQYLLTAQFIMFFIGLKDDIFVLSARKKLFIQIFCALILIFLGGHQLDNFYGVFGIDRLSQTESVIFTLLVYLSLINSFNFIDGINWLAGLIGVSASTFLGIWFALNGFKLEAGICFSLIGSLIAFLIYNKSPARIFMGDTGSLLIGITISFLIISFINLNHTDPNLIYKFRSAPPIAISLMFVPILDTLRVITIRLWERRSPFSPDKNHLHHLLISSGRSHMKTSIILFLVNTMAIITSLVLHGITGKLIIPMLFLIGYAAISLLTINKIKKNHTKKKHNPRVESSV